ncbi:hypothetical protein [Burkholderia pyrrocinia]|uniref:hypothetical protein n=1 Tax=Burkholderia pyrrocinia TaxID=60550 RepID=UPI001BCDDC56|nr:hypothetical protein [Burkholderia pyrrocinia]QVN17339.1 hypothetical protein JYG32_13855 [Burkholderia pyrrocinia]
MTPFIINVAFDESGLEKIYADGLTCALARPVASSVVGSAGSDARSSEAPGEYPIAWVVFKPLKSNKVVIEDAWFVYMTTTPLRAAETIHINAITDLPAVAGIEYRFRNGHFDALDSTGRTALDVYSVVNQVPNQIYAFGLAQSAIVNNKVQSRTATNAAYVPWNMQAFFQPQHVVEIFLSSCKINGTVCPEVRSDRLRLTYDAGTSEANVVYSTAANRFYLMPSR